MKFYCNLEAFQFFSKTRKSIVSNDVFCQNTDPRFDCTPPHPPPKENRSTSAGARLSTTPSTSASTRKTTTTTTTGRNIRGYSIILSKMAVFLGFPGGEEGEEAYSYPTTETDGVSTSTSRQQVSNVCHTRCPLVAECTTTPPPPVGIWSALSQLCS